MVYIFSDISVCLEFVKISAINVVSFSY